MASLNKIILIGHLGGDPTIVTTPAGKKIAKFSIATSSSTKDASGNYVDTPQWHNIVVLGNDKLSEMVESRFKRGMRVYVEGSIKYGTYKNKQGNDVTTVEVLVMGFNSQLVLLEYKAPSASSAEEFGAKAIASAYPNAQSDLTDDSIPF
jgi:single-strand DNA-binding protein